MNIKLEGLYLSSAIPCMKEVLNSLVYTNCMCSCIAPSWLIMFYCMVFQFGDVGYHYEIVISAP